jgi:hypothetical protein
MDRAIGAAAEVPLLQRGNAMSALDGKVVIT